VTNRPRSSLARVRPALTRTRIRVGLGVVVLLSTAVVAAAASGGLSASKEAVPEALPTENHTVVTESGRAGTITAYQPDEEVLYYNNSRTKYFDVDPVEGDPLTVEYTATDTIHTDGPNCGDPPCARNVIERVDLETGAVEVVYERYDHKETAAEWHDMDRIDERHVLVADIVADQVFIVDTGDRGRRVALGRPEQSSRWRAATRSNDWTHINDVEYIEDGRMEGRIMVSVRNQNRVVFLDQGRACSRTGLSAARTTPTF